MRESRLYSRKALIMSISDTIRSEIKRIANERDFFITFYKQDRSRVTSSQDLSELLA